MNVNRIKELVENGMFTKVELSDRCGFSRTTLDNILSGADAKVSSIESIAKVFNVPMSYLFGEDMPILSIEAEELVKAKEEIMRLKQVISSMPTKSTKVMIELDVTEDEFIKLGLKDKVLQILNKQ
ncbi:helix-turn-helix transcriptional regulator [uncultured Bacteroides sp.]|uniref:helix-turn-helix domain-containing protein n=1 Tax=uncultured Bacteroides sp. TaxID=162156 RepID=UPI0025EEC1DC|nr:helix-turn-helix transcriptional regulator [uncultured Bacteroides sp.]